MQTFRRVHAYLAVEASELVVGQYYLMSGGKNREAGYYICMQYDQSDHFIFGLIPPADIMNWLLRKPENSIYNVPDDMMASRPAKDLTLGVGSNATSLSGFYEMQYLLEERNHNNKLKQ